MAKEVKVYGCRGKTRTGIPCSVCKYTKKDGPYTKGMKKCKAHKQDVIMLGKPMNLEPCQSYVCLQNRKAILVKRDFIERQGLAKKVNTQMQYEYYNQTSSLGNEGITVYLRRPGDNKYDTWVFPVLSTKGCQDGCVVYYNA